MSPRILVTDGEQRAALAVVRSLGLAGYEVTVVSPRRRCLAGASRYARLAYTFPDSLSHPDAFGEAVQGLLANGLYDVVLPIADPSLLALLDRRDRLRATIPWPDLAAVHALADKQAVTDAARGIGIHVPRQVSAATRQDAERLAKETGFPLVVKPVRSVSVNEGERVKTTVRLVNRPEALAGALDTLPGAAWPVLLQERIHGPGVGIFLLLWDGDLRAAFAHQRLREKPPTGGVSTYRESIPADPGLVAQSRALLETVGWQGVAMVEYKLDLATGRPCLMEINGRFWGSLQLAIDAGVDFPRLLVDLALDRDPGPPPAYRTGVRSRWCWGDLDHLLARLRHSRESLGLGPDAPSRWRVGLEVLIPWRPGDRWEILRLSDPRPFLRETADWFRGL